MIKLTQTICLALAMLLPAFAQDPAPANMKLFLLIGQSNMAGRGKIEPQDQVENPRIFMLTKDLKWVPAKDPVHFDKPGMAGVGLCSQFARDVLKADPTATIGLIPCAVGGTSLDQWKVGGPLYTTAVTRTKEALKQGQLAGILWHQGESDSGNPKNVASYADRLSVMIAQLRADLQAEKVPVVLGELIHDFKTNDSINVELAAAAKKIPLCILVSSEGLGKKQLHFDAADLRTFGQRYAVDYLKLAKP
jgi:Carbohydrate esterase, sialic acid-specific acetylesterase